MKGVSHIKWRRRSRIGRKQSCAAMHKVAVGRCNYLMELDKDDVVPCIVDVFEIAIPKSALTSRNITNACLIG